jgi:SPP1 family predicted phage head-tail adaptor
MDRKENKDKKVQFYRLNTQVVDGYEKVIKTYIHSKESGGLWCFVRELSENERFSAKSVQVEETTQFKVVYNPKIVNELYLEFNGKTYDIVSIDGKEFNKSDLVIRANEILAPSFDEVRYENY